MWNVNRDRHHYKWINTNNLDKTCLYKANENIDELTSFLHGNHSEHHNMWLKTNQCDVP